LPISHFAGHFQWKTSRIEPRDRTDTAAAFAERAFSLRPGSPDRTQHGRRRDDNARAGGSQAHRRAMSAEVAALSGSMALTRAFGKRPVTSSRANGRLMSGDSRLELAGT